MSENAKRFIQNLTAIGSIVLLALERLGSLSQVLAGLKLIRQLVTNWTEYVGFGAGVVRVALEKGAGLTLSEPYERLLPTTIQLALVVVAAFWRFGATPYVVQASDSLGNRIWIHYPVHLICCFMLLLFVLPIGLSPGEFLAVGFGGSVLDAFVGAFTLLLLLVILIWHPGISMTVLGVMICLVAIGYLVDGGMQYFDQLRPPQ